MGADSSDAEAKIWFSGYYKCQKSKKNCFSPSDGGASELRWGGIAPSSPPRATPGWTSMSGLPSSQSSSEVDAPGIIMLFHSEKVCMLLWDRGR